MANILVFEDDLETICEYIQPALQDSSHEIVGCADSLQRAQQFISKIISQEIEVDILLLDGNLDRRFRPSEFRHTLPLDGTEPIKRNLFGKVKPARPREIVVPNNEQGIGGDARMVKKILDVCQIDLPIIGISGDSMMRNGVDVAKDIGKWGLRNNELLPAIESLTSL